MPSQQNTISPEDVQVRPRRRQARGGSAAVATTTSVIPYPLLFELNTRARVAERAWELGRPASLDDIPDSELDAWARQGFDWIWLLGVWQTGPAGRSVSLSNPEWREEYRRLLPDLKETDICGSCFAIKQYVVHAELGGEDALARFRERLKDHGLRLMLDFVPNHTAPDHPWVNENPGYYISGTPDDLAREPRNYLRVETQQGTRILAHGRDPNFPGWPDTLQLNYGDAGLRVAMRDTLGRLATICDGVRCDMAMLVLPDIFQRTWGIAIEPFWPEAIARARQQNPQFVFMAEAYWDLEWTLQQQGFDYVYDKRLYDRLRDRAARPVRDHLRADLAYQNRLARFMENHDEPRAADVFPADIHRAAAIITFLSPGLRLFHDGQFEGRRARLPVHLQRRPIEMPNREIASFYEGLLTCLSLPTFRSGRWQLLECKPAWDGNWTWDDFIAMAWQDDAGIFLVVVHYASNQGQCYVPLPFSTLRGRSITLIDRTGQAVYERDGDELATRGLYLDMPGWGYHVFDLREREARIFELAV